MSYPKIALREFDAQKERILEHGGEMIVWTEDEIRDDADGALDDDQTVIVYEPVYKLKLTVTKKLVKSDLKEKK